MDLTAYLAAMRSLIAPTSQETGIYTDDLLTEGLRQALREYEEQCYPVTKELTAVAGRSQSLTTVTDLVDLVAVVWPWVTGASWTAADTSPTAGGSAGLARYTVGWRWLQNATIYVEDGEPRAGDKILIYYRKRQKVMGLDAAPATSVWPEHESLLVLGAAAWAVEIRYRQTSEALKAPPTEQIKRMYTWSYLRLNEFRNGLKDLTRGGGPVRANWGGIGL